jgi:hypothetical protein
MRERTLIAEIGAELERARAMFPAFRSEHEGYAILLEEVDELWDEVKRHNLTKGRDRRPQMRMELIQVATMAIRFIEDLLEEQE